MAENGEARDERLAGQLEVEPLDELTRRRLVTTAMRASAPPTAARSRRLVAAAAIAVVLIGAGVGYLATRDGDTGAPAASRDTSAPATTGGSANAGSVDERNHGESFTPSAAPASPTPQSERSTAYADAATLQDAGDFGDLRVPANVDRLRAALASSDLAAKSAGPSPSDRVAGLLAALRSRSCASELPEGAVVAVASGRFGARDAIVVLTQLPDGTRSTDAVLTDPCEIRPLD